MFLRQSTSQVILFGPCLDKGDGVTEETGLTLAQADMRLSKDGGAFAQKNTTGNATHDSDGWYSTTLDTTDTNTCGELILNVHQPANMLPVWSRYWVLEEAIYDAMFGASAAGFDANQRVDVGSWLGTAVTTSATSAKPEVDVNSVSDDATAANNLELDYDGTGYNKSNSTIGTTTANSDMRGTDSAALASVCTEARLAELDAGNLPTDVAGVITTAMVEPTGPPSVTGTIAAGIAWLVALSRNKATQTASTKTLRNDADDTNIATSAVSDDGTTFTRGEWS